MTGIAPSVTRNIIFDLGGVLLNINPLLSLIEFEKISGLGREELTKRLIQEQVFEKIDTGRLSPAEFRLELCRIMGQTVSDSEIDRAWNTLLLDFPRHRVELLQQLRKNYGVFLLSNTNIIHFGHYTDAFYRNYGFPMADLFDSLFLSYEIGIHKPDAGIYTHVLQSASIDPTESVFIDDSLANIEAAELEGITGIHIHNGLDVTDFFLKGRLMQDV
jgi:putative hydrolase of the HAD superfamily